MKTLLRSYEVILRSYYVLQVLTASIQFFKDVVRTGLSVKGEQEGVSIAFMAGLVKSNGSLTLDLCSHFS